MNVLKQETPGMVRRVKGEANIERPTDHMEINVYKTFLEHIVTSYAATRFLFNSTMTYNYIHVFFLMKTSTANDDTWPQYALHVCFATMTLSLLIVT